MTATLTHPRRQPLTPALSLFLAVVAIVIGSIALATGSHTTTLVPTTPAVATPAAATPAVTTPARGGKTGPGGVAHVAIPGGYVVQAGTGTGTHAVSDSGASRSAPSADA